MREIKKIIPWPLECHQELLREALTQESYDNCQIILKQLMYNLNQEIHFLAKYKVGGEELLQDIRHRSLLRSSVRRMLAP